MSKTFFEAMNETSREQWQKIAADIKGVDQEPDIFSEIEGLDEIAEIMQTIPGFEKEEK